jgi:hypothetical protein
VSANRLAGLLAVASVLGCGSGDAEGCPGIARAFVTVIVTDAVSQARICDATVSVRVGDLDYELQAAGNPCSYLGMRGELNAEHAISVVKTGYQAFSRTVTVPESGCGLADTQTVEAKLELE